MMDFDINVQNCKTVVQNSKAPGSTSKEGMSEIDLAFELIYHTIGKKDERGNGEKERTPSQNDGLGYGQ